MNENLIDIFCELKERQIDPTVKDNYGRTALHYTCLNNTDWLAISFINNFKFDIEAIDNSGHRALSYVFQ